MVFGSVGGGGRYDGLVSRFRCRTGPRNGLFHRRLRASLIALKLTGNLGASDGAPGPDVEILVLDNEQAAVASLAITSSDCAGQPAFGPRCIMGILQYEPRQAGKGARGVADRRPPLAGDHRGSTSAARNNRSTSGTCPPGTRRRQGRFEDNAECDGRQAGPVRVVARDPEPSLPELGKFPAVAAYIKSGLMATKAPADTPRWCGWSSRAR